jgi:transposase
VGGDVRLLVGDDWAEDHHDVEVLDAAGRRLARARLPEGVAGIARLHAIIGELAGQDVEDEHVEVLVGIETDRGPWVTALVAAGYQVVAVNPLQAARYRERHTVSGAKATPVTHMCWPTWSAPTPTSCARSLGTAPRPKRSRW